MVSHVYFCGRLYILPERLMQIECFTPHVYFLLATLECVTKVTPYTYLTAKAHTFGNHRAEPGAENASR